MCACMICTSPEVQRILITQYPTILPEIIAQFLDVYLYINGEKSFGT